jgi:predicted metallo-beta-lactamase superfamily hydrolase
MTKAEKQELKEIKDLLQKILEKLENLKIEKIENHYHYRFYQPKKLIDGYKTIWNYPSTWTWTCNNHGF